MPNIRNMLRADLSTVVALEAEQTDLEVWPERLFRDCLLVGYSCWIMEEKINSILKVIGFGLLSCAASEAHILKLLISQEHRGKGFGKYFLHHLLTISKQLAAEKVYLEVRQSNEIARNLYRTAGFTEIGIRKNYYNLPGGGKEDAISLSLELSETH